MKKIALTQGKFALIDDEDYERLSGRKWCASFTGGIWYAKSRGYLMHREVLAAKLGRPLGNREYADHIDWDGLNNSRANLRLATKAQNNKHRKNKRGKYWGISWMEGCRRWAAKLKDPSGKTLNLGVFKDDTEAARQFDQASIRLFGEFANLNFPAEGIDPDWQFPQREYTSTYAGVTWHKRIKKWQSRVMIDGVMRHLGYYIREDEAATAYDNISWVNYGMAERLNFPERYIPHA